MSCKPKARRILAASLALCASWVGPAAAQNQVRVIPYEGHLRVAGELGDVTIPMRFTLYDSDGTSVWSEEYSATPETNSCDVDDCSVPVYGGRFSVGLGQYETSLLGLDWSDDYYLGIELHADGGWFDLDNRERLAPVPWAFLAEQAESYAVDGAVTVAGHLNCQNTAINAASLNVTGTVDVDSSITAPQVSIFGSASAGSEVRLSGDLSGATLQILDGEPISLDTSARALWGDDGELEFNPSAALSNGVDIGGNLTVATADFDGGLQATSTNGNGTLYMEDWSIVGGRALFSVSWVTLSGGNGYQDTDINYDNYWCFVGGFALTDGDLSSSNVTSFFQYNTYQTDDNDWGVQLNTPHNSDAESEEIAVICVQRQAAVVPDDWFERFESFP